MRLLLILSVLALAACGGGNGGAAPSPPRDTTPPVITLVGDDPQAIIAGDPYTELGATAVDNLDGDVSGSIIVDATGVRTEVSGTYTVSYEVADSSGNVSSLTRDVRVLVTGSWTPASFAPGPGDADGHTAVTLQDGRVLIVGRKISLFDPVASSTSILADFDRPGHTSTLLLDGRVLLSGGRAEDPSRDIAVPTADAFLFDPITSTISAAGAMRASRATHTATLLENGQVLLAGGVGLVPAEESGLGVDAILSLDSAEIYDPGSSAFFDTGPLHGTRRDHTATRLVDGAVLIVGGWDDGREFRPSVEIYRLATGTFQQTALLPGDGKVRHTATRMPDGRVLLVGGGPLVATLIYEPDTDSFIDLGRTGIPDYADFRDSHVAVPLRSTPDCPGPILVAGGTIGEKSTIDSAMIFDPVLERFYDTESLLRETEDAAGVLLLDGRVFIYGGWEYETGPISSAEVFEPLGACN